MLKYDEKINPIHEKIHFQIQFECYKSMKKREEKDEGIDYSLEADLPHFVIVRTGQQDGNQILFDHASTDQMESHGEFVVVTVVANLSGHMFQCH